MKEGGKERRKKNYGRMVASTAGVANSTAVCRIREKFKVYFYFLDVFECVFELILGICYC